jgi:hypothetical protein
MASYSAGAVKTYRAASGLMRFKNKNNFYKFEETLCPTTTLA